MELAPLVASFAQENRGRYRRRLFRLAHRLATGTPLADALEQTPGSLSDEQLLGVRLGYHSGNLPQVLQALVERPDRSLRQVQEITRRTGRYVLVFGGVAFLVITFLMTKIMPAYNKIFYDFELQLAHPTLLLIEVSNWFVDYWFLLILPLLFAVWLVKSEYAQRVFRRRINSRLFQPALDLRSAGIMNLLALVQEWGRPLAGAISTLARYHYDSLVRHRLLFVRNEMEQGADLWNSMAAAQLITPAEARALGTAPADSGIWTLEHLAEWKRSRVARRFMTVLSFVFPAVILALASVVLLVALGGISPLVKLIEGLTG
jgi:type II secretory pathway component PulF